MFAAVMACTLQHGHCRGSTSNFFARCPFMNRCRTPYGNSASSRISTASRRTYGGNLHFKPQKIMTKQSQVTPTMCAQSITGATEAQRRDITPLHIAAKNGDLQTAQSLLAHGADVNAKESEDKEPWSWGWTPLHHAALHGHMDMVKLLLSHGAAVDATDSEGATPLAVTVCCKHKPLTELLLSEGACPSPQIWRLCRGAPDAYGEVNPLSSHPLAMYCVRLPATWTPLNHTVFTNQADIVSLLLAYGVDPDEVGTSDPRELAIIVGNLDLFKLLCTRKYHDSNKNPGYLRLAVMYNQADIVEHALSLGLNAAEIDDFGVGKDVLQAADADRLRLVQSLLAHGADIHAADSLGWTALHLAASNRSSPAVVDALCKHGANPNATNIKGRTPLHHAAFANNVEATKVLLRFGANEKAVDTQGQTVFHSAASQDSSKLWGHADPKRLYQSERECLELVNLTYNQTVGALLAHGADVSACNYQGLTALHCAALDENLEMLKTLVGCDVDLNARTLEDWTPLHYAVHKCSNEMARVLIDAGADVSAKDEKGCTPLHGCAETYTYASILWTKGGKGSLHAAAELADLLVAHGADPATQNKQGKTPLDLALSHDHSPLVHVLSKVEHQAQM